MIGFEIISDARRLDGFPDQLRGQVGAAVLGLAEDLADDARARVLDQRQPDRPLPSVLANSITVEPDGTSAVVRTDVPYAPYVEFGSRKMPARPFLTPAAEYMRGIMGGRIADAIRSLFQGRIA